MSELSRRRMLQASGMAAAGLALAACTNAADDVPPGSTPSSGGTAPGGARRPNILMIVADDIGYTDLGCFGGEIPTPNLDRLAEQGRRFTQMLTNPMCCPSRASMLTGLYPTQAGVGYYTRDYGAPGYVGHLNDNCVTLPEVLQGVGYRTAISGKWHVSNWRTPSAEPPARGFERSFCEMGGNGYFTTERYLDGEPIGISPDPAFYMTNAITDFSRKQIQTFAAESDDPFFIYTAYTAPHFPLQAPADDIAPFHGAYRSGWDELRESRFARAQELGIADPQWQLPPRPEGVQPWADVRGRDWQSARMEVYAAQVAVMDRGIGELLDTLDELGIADDTLVLFLGDNGASAETILPGSHADAPTRSGRPIRTGNDPTIFPGSSDTFSSYGKPWGSATASPFRRYKLWVEEGGISTPLIASWPARLEAGGIDHRPLHVMDFMPTFVDLAEATYPATYRGNTIRPVQGQSFANVLSGATDADDYDHERWLFWEFEGHRAVRHGTWKIVADSGTEQWRLYDMAADRTENVDLASQHPSLVTRMSYAWLAWSDRVGVVPWNPITQYSAI